MKVILLEDVKNVGKKEQIINASDGYAKNFLFPKKLAVEASKENMKEYELKKKADEKKKLEELAQAKAFAEKLSASEILIKVKTGGNGKLFGSVTNKEIGDALEKQTGYKIDKKKIVLQNTIKMVGSSSVSIKIHPQVTAEVTVKIEEA